MFFFLFIYLYIELCKDYAARFQNTLNVVQFLFDYYAIYRLEIMGKSDKVTHILFNCYPVQYKAFAE